MKKVIQIIKYNIVLAAVIIIMLVPTKIFADVGSFESYDSSDYDYDYSYDYDDDYDYSYDDYSGGSSYSSSGSGDSEIDVIDMKIFIVIIIILVYVSNKKKQNNLSTNYYRNNTNNQPIITEQIDVEERVKKIDELFNEEEFLGWAKDLFVKLQEAWTARDWSTIRCFESNELFEQHQKQLQGYIDNHQINKMERICVKTAKLSKFEQSGDKDILTVILSSKMIDYIIDDRTNEVIKGDKITDRHSTYKMVFIRKTGVKTKEEGNLINTTNCPNCGAPTQITSSGKCEYCGSVITTGEFNWVLSNLEKIN